MKLSQQFGIDRLKSEVPAVAFVCPACSSEISLKELIEEKGYVGCINCVR